MLTQVELEEQTYAFGRVRAERIMSRNEEAGRANANPYAQAIYRRYVLPLAELIRTDLADKKPGRRQAHVALLSPMDPEAVAYLAVRNTLNTLVGGLHIHGHRPDFTANVGARGVSTAVGRAVYHELLLALFEHAEPELFYTLVNDLERRRSKQERHRMTVFKMQADKNGISFPDWGPAGSQQVGAYLVDGLARLGMVSIELKKGHGSRAEAKSGYDCFLTDEAGEVISQIREHVAETTPYFLPCVEPPRDWVSISDGGFHTRGMRRLMPYAVRSYGAWSEVAEADLSQPLQAINALQRVPWAISGAMLDAIRAVAQCCDMDEILSQAEHPAPPKPDFLFGDRKMADMTPDEQERFIDWKRQKAQWHTERKLRGTKFGRFQTAMAVAERFREYPAIYFVYFADFRGRLYAQTTGVSPQGSDMQKALLRFARGKPLDTPEAVRWFCIHGANKWGFDKASLDARAMWHQDKRELLLSFADDPVSNRGWQDADCPLQFLAWCQEYAAWQRDPAGFVSHLPVGMDGSCNGLQNLSAMLRDEIGGRATNLVPGPKPNDIYQMVADVTARRLMQAEDDEKGFRRRWLAHGINRALVKRSVMTLPYGSTRFSCADFIVGDYLRTGKAAEFEAAEYNEAARYLSHFVWDSIADVVVKAREAMAWLQSGARKIIKRGGDRIEWTTPTGFRVIQLYQEQEVHRINTRLSGGAKIRVLTDKDEADLSKHKNGIAPNFVHSLDAAHLTKVTVAGAGQQMDLAMIHDDYGTHAADAGKLYRLIRETFVAMYSEHDPLGALAAAYDLPPPPAAGDLDLSAVLASEYFFS